MTKSSLLFFPGMAFLLILSGCDSPPVCAPDKVLVSKDKKTMFVADRANKEILRLSSDLRTVRQRQCFPSPVADMQPGRDNTLWVVCEGPQGMLYQLSDNELFEWKQFSMGHSPSSLSLSPRTGNLWITQRYLNEVWEVSPDNGKVISRTPVGREPVGTLPFLTGDALLVIHNLPEQDAASFPISARVDILDTREKQPVSLRKKIYLPNGSTDVRAVTSGPKGQFAYIVHLLARYQLPTNQVERGWMSTNALSIIDLQKGEYVNTVLLDTPQKGAANPADVKVTEDGNNLVVSLSGVDELEVVDLPALHERLDKARRGEKVSPSSASWKDIPNDASFLHGIRRFLPTAGKGPRGLAVNGNTLYAVNYFSGDLASWDNPSSPLRRSSLGTSLSTTPEGRGEMYFHDATLCFQGWQSCASCHPNNARMDGLNWDLLNDGAGNPKNTKSMLFAHRTPPCMITGIRKDAETAVRSGLKYILFAHPDENISRAMDDYLISLIPVPSPRLVHGRPSESAQRGEKHFEAHCASCHSGSLMTDGKQYPVSWATGKTKDTPLDVPTLREVWRTAPYLYDGRSATMEEMLQIHGPGSPLSHDEIKDLEEYVLSL